MYFNNRHYLTIFPNKVPHRLFFLKYQRTPVWRILYKFNASIVPSQRNIQLTETNIRKILKKISGDGPDTMLSRKRGTAHARTGSEGYILVVILI